MPIGEYRDPRNYHQDSESPAFEYNSAYVEALGEYFGERTDEDKLEELREMLSLSCTGEDLDLLKKLGFIVEYEITDNGGLKTKIVHSQSGSWRGLLDIDGSEIEKFLTGDEEAYKHAMEVIRFNTEQQEAFIEGIIFIGVSQNQL